MSGGGGAYTNHTAGSLLRRPTPLGWSLSYDRSDVKFSEQEPLVTQLARGRLLFLADPSLELSASGGYENNDYTFSQYRNAIYGVGFTWRPSERTTLDANWEKRFFGSSYNVVFSLRAPLSAWSLSAVRDVTSYPQQLAQLSGGVDVRTILDQLFRTQIPDPVLRQQAIDQYIRDNQLPLMIFGPVNVFAQQVYLSERIVATVGLLGARNTVVFTLAHAKTTPMSAPMRRSPARLPDSTTIGRVPPGRCGRTTFTPSLTLVVDGSVSRAVDNTDTSRKSDQGSLNARLETPLSASTSAYAGARYQILKADVSERIKEAAVFVGLTHTFR